MSSLLLADVDGDGCLDALRYADGVLEAAGRRWSVGQAGDVAATGDWSCRGVRTLALLRPSTGEVFPLAGWDGEVTARAAGRVEGGQALRAADVDRDGCHELVVERGALPAEVLHLSRAPAVTRRSAVSGGGGGRPWWSPSCWCCSSRAAAPCPRRRSAHRAGGRRGSSSASRSTAAFALLRLAALAGIWYLAGVTCLGAVLRAMRAVRLVAVADRFTVAPVRRLLAGTLTAGLVGLGPVGAAAAQPAAPTTTTSPRPPPAPPARPPTATSDTVVLRRLPPDPAPNPTRRPGADARHPSPPAERPPARWTVEPGDCFWTIAEEVLQQAWGRAPTDAEIVPYWRA